MSDAHIPVFRRAVVALNGGPSDARIVRLVSEVARPSKAEVVAVHVVEIDWTLPLDADIAGRSEEVQRVLDTAEEVAEDSKMVLEPVLLQARDVGAAIVDGRVNFVIFFWDPLEPQPHDVDVKALLRVAVVHNVPIACNRSTADFLLSSPLMSEDYERRVSRVTRGPDRQLLEALTAELIPDP
jgi:hypothetical protein